MDKVKLKNRGNTLYLVVPCYNEEEVLPHTAAVMLEKYEKLVNGGLISHKSKIMFVMMEAVIGLGGL